MPPRCLACLRYALVVAMLATPFLAGEARATDKSLEPQADSLQSVVDTFVS